MWTSCSLYVQYLQRNICNRKYFVVDHIEGSIKSERSKILNLILSYSSEINGCYYPLRTLNILSRNHYEIFVHEFGFRSFSWIISLGAPEFLTGTTSNFFESLQRYLKFNLQHRWQVGNDINGNWEKWQIVFFIYFKDSIGLRFTFIDISCRQSDIVVICQRWPLSCCL
jgi:hypothetical protein